MSWIDKPTQRYKQLPKNWQAIRQQVLTRDHYTCVKCGKPGNHVDHIERGQNHNPHNLRTLCEHCHMVRTGRDGGVSQHKKRKRKRVWDNKEKHPAYI